MLTEFYIRRKKPTAYPSYYANLNEKKVSDNKPLGKVIKHSLSDKSCVKEQINLAEKGEI